MWRGLINAVVVLAGFAAFHLLDRPAAPDPTSFSAALPDWPACQQISGLTACAALRLYDRRTHIDLGHAHSRVSYRMDLDYLWRCQTGEELQMKLRAQFLVEHVHADVFVRHASELPSRLPIRDLLRLRHAPPSHQTNFLLEILGDTTSLDPGRLLGVPITERRAGPGFIALGYPEPDIQAIAMALGCQPG